MLSFIILGLSLAPFIAAQSVPIEAIEAHFEQSGIVPSLLPTFDPTSTLTVNFPGVGDIQPGQPLTTQQSGSEPTVTLTPGNSSTTYSGNYTIMMVDADIVGTDESGGVNHHWLVNSVTIDSNKVTTTNGVAITKYAGPGPASGSGAHRYVILIYSQPATFTSPSGFTPGLSVSKFSLSSYLQDSNMGSLVGGMYFTVEVGTATVTVSSTQPVVSSTLASAAPSGSGSPSTSATGAKPSNSNSATMLGFSSTGLLAAVIAALFA